MMRDRLSWLSLLNPNKLMWLSEPIDNHLSLEGTRQILVSQYESWMQIVSRSAYSTYAQPMIVPWILYAQQAFQNFACSFW